ncbi:MAG: hypothetical protein DWQ37_05005 [Planctomycetota bacterium]|nr:MAG: hypothetical protein DWQ37_05005 [Planctomycetota bacterium]
MSGTEPPSDELGRGTRIRIISGTFETFEAIVSAVDETTGKVSAEIWIFGKATPVELERGQFVRIS